MFVGHYAASFALKAYEEKASLGWLFVGVQFFDLLFFPLTLMGIERFKLIENFTASTHFKLEFMPYSHSLVAAFFWAGLIFLLASLIARYRRAKHFKVAAVMAVAVLSHWFLDLVVHTPDLPLMSDDSVKFGWGLWHYAFITYGLEAILLLGGLYFYMRSSRGTTLASRVGMPIFVVLLLLINVLNIFGPLSPSDDVTSTAITATIAYLVLAAIAFVLDRKRIN